MPVKKVIKASAIVAPHELDGAPIQGNIPIKLQPRMKKKIVHSKGTKRSASS